MYIVRLRVPHASTLFGQLPQGQARVVFHEEKGFLLWYDDINHYVDGRETRNYPRKLLRLHLPLLPRWGLPRDQLAKPARCNDQLGDCGDCSYFILSLHQSRSPPHAYITQFFDCQVFSLYGITTLPILLTSQRTDSPFGTWVPFPYILRWKIELCQSETTEGKTS